MLDATEAEEAAQEAWMAAWQRLEGFRGDASFKTWVTAIAWRKALDRRRAVVTWLRRLAPAARDHNDGSVDVAALPDTRTGDAQGRLLDREARSRIGRALRGLPRAQRDCLLLAAGGELTYEEIGAVLGMPVGSVKWRVSEARKRLRVRMEGLK